MSETIAADVSYYQPKVNNDYNRRWLIFRCCDGSFVDPNGAFNVSWAKAALKDGRLDGWTAYVVFRPGATAVTLRNLDNLGLTGGHVMIDVESWGGQITGDHSVEINGLGRQIAARVGWDHVWIYGNQGDLARLAPGRDSRMRVVVASYGGSKPNVPNMVGWQYTNGIWQVDGLPTASPPFGNCDHNVLYDPISGVQPESKAETPLAEGVPEDMYELVRDDDGGVYQFSALVFRHVPTAEFWKVMESSPLCIGQRTRQINNRERDIMRGFVNWNLAAVKAGAA